MHNNIIYLKKTHTKLVLRDCYVKFCDPVNQAQLKLKYQMSVPLCYKNSFSMDLCRDFSFGVFLLIFKFNLYD